MDPERLLKRSLVLLAVLEGKRSCIQGLEETGREGFDPGLEAP